MLRRRQPTSAGVVLVGAVFAAMAVVAVVLLVIATAESLGRKLAEQTEVDTVALGVSGAHALALDANAALNLATVGINALAVSTWMGGMLAGSLMMLSGMAVPEGLSLMVESLDIANEIASLSHEVAETGDTINMSVVPGLALGIAGLAATDLRAPLVPWPIAPAGNHSNGASAGDCLQTGGSVGQSTPPSPASPGIDLAVDRPQATYGYGSQLMLFLDVLLGGEDAPADPAMAAIDAGLAEARKAFGESVLELAERGADGDANRGAQIWSDAVAKLRVAVVFAVGALMDGNDQKIEEFSDRFKEIATSFNKNVQFAMPSDLPSEQKADAARQAVQAAAAVGLVAVDALISDLRDALAGGAEGDEVIARKIVAEPRSLLAMIGCGIANVAGMAISTRPDEPTQLPADFTERQAFVAAMMRTQGGLRMAAARSVAWHPDVRAGEPIMVPGARTRLLPVAGLAPEGGKLREVLDAFVQH